MKRDFSESAERELLALVKQAEDEKWCDFTDWFGDRWLDIQATFGFLNLDADLSNARDFHKAVIDKNNMSADKIKKIFSAVRDTDESYGTRFAALASQVDSLRAVVDAAAEAVAPGNSLVNAGAMDALQNALADYTAAEGVLEAIAGDEGLSEGDLEGLDNDLIQDILSSVIGKLAAVLPNVSVGQELSIPIGVGLVVYYSVTSTAKGNMNLDLGATIDSQRMSFKNFTAGTEVGDALRGGTSISSDGGLSVSGGAGGTSFQFGNGGFTVSSSVKSGNNTYTISQSANIVEELTFEESITSDVEDAGSVTSTIGIQKTSQSDWKPLPAVEPAYSPVDIHIPSYDIDWGTLAIGASVACAAVGLMLAIPTSGASLVLVAV